LPTPVELKKAIQNSNAQDLSRMRHKQRFGANTPSSPAPDTEIAAYAIGRRIRQRREIMGMRQIDRAGDRISGPNKLRIMRWDGYRGFRF
jgi:hypothetical protein